MTAALSRRTRCCAEVPLHPSYEDRPGAQDRVFASLGDAVFEHHAHAWARALAGAGAQEADVLHLHHLTPINAAAALVAPGVPVVGHLHGTELLMLDAIVGDPGRWAHGAAWAERMRAGRRLRAADRALGVPGRRADGCWGSTRRAASGSPTGSTPRPSGRALDHLAHWRRHLVEAPRGWAPGGGGGSVRYAEADLAAFGDDRGETLVLSKSGATRRSSALAADRGLRPGARALHPPRRWCWSAASRASGRASTRSRRSGAPAPGTSSSPAGATTRELPDFFAASDIVVLPSVREQFGQVLVEGGACGLPAIAVDAYGPAEIVRDGETGRLVPPDDREALAAALVEAVNDPVERRRRGERPAAEAPASYAWPALAARVAEVYAVSSRP